MLDQGYTSGNFRKLLRPIDFSRKKHNLPQDNGELDGFLLDIEKDYQDGNVDFSLLKEVIVKGKKVYKAEDFTTDIVLRKLNDTLRRLYAIKQPDRTDIVRQIIEMASDGSPIQFIRRDIKSFYESVSRDKVIKKINDDYLLGWESKSIINSLFESTSIAVDTGLPRGLGISATLAELYMRPFDKIIKNIEGVLYYARYVDDIIIISYKNYNSIESDINNEVGRFGLELNDKKSPPALLLPEKSKNLCSCEVSCACDCSVEYLGYKLSFPKASGGWDRKRNGRYVSVTISSDKVRRFKYRVVMSFLDYAKNNEFYLLRKRISYLTSNYPLPLNKFKENLRGGIYYNYQLINDKRVLDELDVFLRRIIFSRSGSLGRKMGLLLTKHQKDMLKKYSFASGFSNKYFVKLTQSDISDVSRCWKYD